MKAKIIIFLLLILVIAGAGGFLMIDTSPPNLTIEQTLKLNVTDE